MANTIITFEDHGQDFLTWTINPQGKVVECTPFQFWLWKKYKVVNKDSLVVGGEVEVLKYKGVDKGRTMTMKYPIKQLSL